MEIVNASIDWPGPSLDVLRLYVEPMRYPWGADPVESIHDIAVLRVLNGNDEATGPVAGVEIVGFLDFDGWDDLPRLPLLWQLPGQEPLALDALLRQQQQVLRRQAEASRRVG